ncbi:phosphoribosylglycinamide formyltransferase [Phocaeicola paurosaccharolyticus]|jgi:phosphoribosylglycinamide formyltransferase 1|uniref:phosphoribosylglycinamide formyltransferase n=1 Tax=Phocaeicola paurosaccharolyticus TaxID=732242 RepID=UPI00046A5989|nr:phosphoribosylglycinamide formyltransferase [Phocaeicola paurosaccharolyticus]
MKNIAIFASGEGTNAERIVRYFLENSTIRVAIIITNKPNAGVIKRAESLGIHALFLTKEELQGERIMEVLKEHDIDFIVLAGYLAKISDEILHIFPNHIINIHPSLLPKYGGKGMYGLKVHQAVLDAKDKESGITIHYINSEYDKGEVIVQEKCEVLDSDTAESLAERVHKLEYKYFPETIEKLLS